MRQPVRSVLFGMSGSMSNSPRCYSLTLYDNDQRQDLNEFRLTGMNVGI